MKIKNKRKSGRELTRSRVRIRDKYTCQDCGLVRKDTWVKRQNKDILYKNGKLKLAGRIRNLDVHHLNGLCGKKSRGYDKLEEIGGLITLCHKCHSNRPEHRLWSEEYRMNRPKTYKK